MKRHAACLAVAVALAVVLRVFSGYAATHATLVIEGSGTFSRGEMLLVGAGNFIANWYIAVVAVLLSAALVTALLLDRRAARGSHAASP